VLREQPFSNGAAIGAFAVSKQVFCLLLAIVVMAGCSEGGSHAAKVKVGARGRMQGFPGRQIEADGPHAELLAKANNALQDGDAEGAIEALEELVRKDPKNRYALYVLSQTLQERGISLAHGREARKGYGLFEKSAKYMRQLKAAVPEMSVAETREFSYALYNEACAEALYGSKEKAISLLEEALQAGFPQPEEITKDEDFKSLRDEPKFKALLDRLQPM
jgi:hypothetical protein